MTSCRARPAPSTRRQRWRPREAGGLRARNEHPDAVERKSVAGPDQQRHQLRRAAGRRDGRPADPAQAVPRRLARAAAGDPDVERREQHRGCDTALRRQRRGDDRRRHGRPDPRRQPPRRPAGQLQHVRPIAGRFLDRARCESAASRRDLVDDRPVRGRPRDPAERRPGSRGAGPSGSFFSASFDNTSEIVDFRAPTAGTYEIRVVNFRCARSTFVGWAHTIA